jgi:anti-sigma regulatory factor (Ser/Thr protein kinase)
VVRAAVEALGTIYGLPAHGCRGIALAVDEALANIIRHAYHGDFNRAIEVNCRVLADRLEFTLLDQGEPPDPVRIAPHALDDLSLSGRGTHIIRSIMDEVIYERTPGGNQLRLSKWLPGAEPGTSGEEKEV